MTLDEARAQASFPLLELDERPDAVYVGERGTVWFLYGTPDAVRLLVAQTPRVAIDEPFVLKKLVQAGTTVEPATVRGEPGVFLSGEPHVVLLLDENGLTYEEAARLAQRRPRLGGGRPDRTGSRATSTRAEALDIARSLR